MRQLTAGYREKDKKKRIEKLHSQIRENEQELRYTDRLIESVNEKIRAIPILVTNEILVPVPVESTPETEKSTTTAPSGEDSEAASRLHTDVCHEEKDVSGKVINSRELQRMEFRVLDFREQWQHFFGYPSVDFHCIIHGMPGEGKSTFAIQFAKYLAENIGRVVYISGEEGFTKTLRDKFMNNNGISGYLDVADLRTGDDILATIAPDDYNFIFIDSLDNMRIDAEKMKRIREQYKNSALITISQSTKDGKIRGSNELVHDCDISVKVENGIAKTTKNRFKEKGMTYEVFNQQGQV